MVASRALLLLALVVPLQAIGCAADAPEPAAEEESVGDSDDALTGTVSVGARFETTARLNFREGPSKSETIQRVLAMGDVVTILKSSPQNGYYKVSNDGDEGWVFGRYIRAFGSGASSGEDDTKSSSSSGGTPTGQVESCKASFYDEGQRTANGERFDPNALTAAHKTLPFNTRVRVTNKGNGKSVTVRINDRGPFVAGRCIDLSRAAFQTISSTSAGTASVTLEVLR